MAIPLTPTWFVTHAHLDHFAALPLLVSGCAVMEIPLPTTIYLPEPVVDLAWDMLKLWERLDKGPQSCTLKGLAAGDEVILSPDCAVTVFATRHPVPSLGYVVWERRQKLKPEFQGLSGPEIRDRREAGIAVTEEQRIPILCYTGDTSPEGLDADPIAFEARVLVTEMSFVRVKHPREDPRVRAHAHRRLHRTGRAVSQ